MSRHHRKEMRAMEDFLKRVIEGTGIAPTARCAEAFESNFAGAINADWAQKEDKYEVVFYKDNIEYIALFDAEGTLEKYKMYLTKELLPVSIQMDLSAEREIMNVVLINEGNYILYEVIVRDYELRRFLVLVDQLGKILSETPL